MSPPFIFLNSLSCLTSVTALPVMSASSNLPLKSTRKRYYRKRNAGKKAQYMSRPRYSARRYTPRTNQVSMRSSNTNEFQINLCFVKKTNDFSAINTYSVQDYDFFKFTLAMLLSDTEIVKSLQPVVNLYRWYKIHHQTFILYPSATVQTTNASNTITATPPVQDYAPTVMFLTGHYGAETNLTSEGEFLNQQDCKRMRFIGNKEFCVTAPCKVRDVVESKTNSSGLEYTAHVDAPWIQTDNASVLHDPGIRTLIDCPTTPHQISYTRIFKTYISFKGLKLYSA